MRAPDALAPHFGLFCAPWCQVGDMAGPCLCVCVCVCVSAECKMHHHAMPASRHTPGIAPALHMSHC